MKDISFVIFTNEKYFDLLELTLPFNIENTKHLNKKIHVVSNKIPKKNLISGVNYIESNIEFLSDGGHFRDTLLFALNNISEDYILFLCDDYIIKSPIKKNRFDNLINVLEKINADFLALGTQKHIENFVVRWNRPNIKLSDYDFPDGCFYEFDESVRHMYSVQPCIWKKKSLITLLEHNKTLTLHQLDNTDIVNKKGERRILIEFFNYSFYEKKENFFDYEFKNYCYHFPPLSYHVDEREISSDFLLIDYIEIVRHGKFLESNVNSKIILNEIFNTNSVKKIKEKLNKFIN